jgi:hypothetical protein
LCLYCRSTAFGKRDNLDHVDIPADRNDQTVAHPDWQVSAVHAASVKANVPGFGPLLGDRACFGHAQKPQQLVDA